MRELTLLDLLNVLDKTNDELETIIFFSGSKYHYKITDIPVKFIFLIIDMWDIREDELILWLKREGE